MTKKFILSILISVTLIIFGVGGYWLWNSKNQPKTTGLPMRLTTNNWPGKYFVEIANKKGWFKEAGLNVELTYIGTDYLGSLNDTVAGKYDGSDFYLFDFIKYNIGGANLVTVLNPDISFGADALVVKPEITRVSGLKGKTIGLPKNSNEEYGLGVVLERNGLTLEDVTIKDMSGEKTSQAFINGEVDAIFTWEPFVYEAIKEGPGDLLFNSSQIPGLMPVVFAFHQKFIDERPGDVQAFMNVWYKTTEYMKKNPQETAQIIADIYKITPKEVAEFMVTDKIFDREANLSAFLDSFGFESLYGTSHIILKYLSNKGEAVGRISDESYHNAMFDDSFLNKLDNSSIVNKVINYFR